MSNAEGSYRTTTKAMMAAYDKLPPAARRAFANALDNWVPQPLLTAYRRGRAGYQTGGEIAKVLANWEEKERAKREQKRRYATGAYKGNAPDPDVMLPPCQRSQR